MADSITFAGVTLTKPRVMSEGYPIASSDVTLIDGKRDIDSESNYGTEFTIRGYTASRADVTALLAKIGTSGSLVETRGAAVTTYTNMRLVGQVKVEDATSGLYTGWFVTLTLRRSTA